MSERAQLGTLETKDLLQTSWHTLDSQATLDRLETTSKGLTPSQVRER
jgi:hypothetical protein